jgi:hypothetical protein
MAQRAQQAGETPDAAFLRNVYDRLAEIEQLANNETDVDELESLSGDAEQQGQLRAYICPRAEISIEGSMSIDRIEEWKVPRAVIMNLGGTLLRPLQTANTKPDDGAASFGQSSKNTTHGQITQMITKRQ